MEDRYLGAAAHRAATRGSHEPPIGEADDAFAPDDQVIEHPDVHERQRLLESSGQHFVRRARFRIPAGMVMDLMCPGSFCGVGRDQR